ADGELDEVDHCALGDTIGDAARGGVGAAGRSVREIGLTSCEPLIPKRLSPKPHAADAERDVVVMGDSVLVTADLEGPAAPHALGTEADDALDEVVHHALDDTIRDAVREGVGAAGRSVREIGLASCEPLIPKRLSPKPHADTEREFEVLGDSVLVAADLEGPVPLGAAPPGPSAGPDSCPHPVINCGMAEFEGGARCATGAESSSPPRGLPVDATFLDKVAFLLRAASGGIVSDMEDEVGQTVKRQRRAAAAVPAGRGHRPSSWPPSATRGAPASGPPAKRARASAAPSLPRASRAAEGGDR
ncbi:unnamed protein product, partial [Prorocentrum cordatum]